MQRVLPMPPPIRTPEELVALIRRAADDDRVAQREILDERLGPVIAARVRKVLAMRRAWALGPTARHAVEDLVQDVLMALVADRWCELRKWDPGRGASLENYVGIIARKKTIAKLRIHKQNPWRERPTEDDKLHDPTNPEHWEPSPALAVADREHLERLLDRARERKKGCTNWLDMLNLVVVERCSAEEICEHTGLTPVAAHKWRSRILALLKEIDAEMSSEPPAPKRTPSTRTPS